MSPLRRTAVVALAAAALLAPAAATAAPDCVSSTGCSFTACYSPSATGTTYYFCDCVTSFTDQPASGCTAGNDTNAGTSPSAPKQHFDQAIAKLNSMNAGDRVSLCQGGVFTASGAAIYNPNCTASTRCEMTDYQASWGGAGIKPEVNPSTTGVYEMNFADSGNADHDEGYRVAGIHFKGDAAGTSGVDATSKGLFFYNDVDYVDVCNVKVDYQIVNEIGSHNTLNAGADAHNAHIHVRNSELVWNSGDGWLGGDDDLQIVNCLINNNGYGLQILDHCIYVGHDGTENAATGVLIQGNNISECTHAPRPDNTALNGHCNGVMVVAHGLHINLTFDGNLLTESLATDLCYGTVADNGYTSAESFTNTTWSHNTYINTGSPALGGQGIVGGTVADNIVLYGNGINGSAIQFPDRPPDTGDSTDTAIVVQGNSGYADQGTGIEISQSGATNNAVVNNVFQFAKSSGTVTLLSLPLSAASYTAVDYNVGYVSGGASLSWEASHSTRSGWNSSTGFDAHSNVVLPQFTNARVSTSWTGALADFLPATGSPLINAGSNSYVLSPDSAGLVRPQGGTVEIGALEVAAGVGVLGRWAPFSFGGF